jgi:hypothetical protein
MNKPFSMRSSAALGTAVLFIFFLAASGPHRVHHFFEENSFSTETPGHLGGEESAHQHHDHSDNHYPEPKPINCPVYSVAQHSQLSILQAFQITFVQTLITGCVDRPVVWLSSTSPSPISQRAPPGV